MKKTQNLKFLNIYIIYLLNLIFIHRTSPHQTQYPILGQIMNQLFPNIQVNLSINIQSINNFYSREIFIILLIKQQEQGYIFQSPNNRQDVKTQSYRLVLVVLRLNNGDLQLEQLLNQTPIKNKIIKDMEAIYTFFFNQHVNPTFLESLDLIRRIMNNSEQDTFKDNLNQKNEKNEISLIRNSN
ncbi:hypothetical protein pb186bvf_007951 [Paramecium bursaria]